VLVKTKHFGDVELDDSKVIFFDNGILGFEDCKRYAILYDEKDGKRPEISWLQSLDEPALALPVISPFIVKPDYNPLIEDELIKHLGDLSDDNIIVLVSVTVPDDVEKISANLKAPFVINADLNRGAQIIVENSDYEIKHYFYEQLKAYKAAKEGK